MNQPASLDDAFTPINPDDLAKPTPGHTRWYIVGTRGHNPATCSHCKQPIGRHDWVDRDDTGEIAACSAPGWTPGRGAA